MISNTDSLDFALGLRSAKFMHGKYPAQLEGARRAEYDRFYQFVVFPGEGNDSFEL